MQVDFYHLTATPLDRALPSIAERVLAAGQRGLIVAGGAAQRASLDRRWGRDAPGSVLPPALVGSDDDGAQPVLIAPDVNAANRARHIALVDGRWRDEALDFDRAFYFFDDERLRAGREAWKALAGREGVDRRYWKQNDAGRWEQAG